MPLLSPALNALKMYDDRQREKSRVISALRNALRVTYTHILDTRIGEFGEEDFKETSSHELSELWSEVARSIRPFDPSVARAFEDKSDYWINPHGFLLAVQDRERRYDYRIRLDEVQLILLDLEHQYGL